jgi:hypothetical protein
VRWLLQVRCAPSPATAAAAAAAIARLRAGAQPPFPDWLEQRLQAQLDPAAAAPEPGAPPRRP